MTDRPHQTQRAVAELVAVRAAAEEATSRAVAELATVRAAAAQAAAEAQAGAAALCREIDVAQQEGIRRVAAVALSSAAAVTAACAASRATTADKTKELVAALHSAQTMVAHMETGAVAAAAELNAMREAAAAVAFQAQADAVAAAAELAAVREATETVAFQAHADAVAAAAELAAVREAAEAVAFQAQADAVAAAAELAAVREAAAAVAFEAQAGAAALRREIEVHAQHHHPTLSPLPARHRHTLPCMQAIDLHAAHDCVREEDATARPVKRSRLPETCGAATDILLDALAALQPREASYNLGAGVTCTNTGTDPSNLVGKTVIVPNKLWDARLTGDTLCTVIRFIGPYKFGNSCPKPAYVIKAMDNYVVYPAAADYLINIIAGNDRRACLRLRRN